ncbi:tetratricopeptide repeat protein [Diaphorobacter nitroreducens]|uniref:tetratricopeptide repeat protein n=1 Tax=Diaphorobacter nitroreducens TaxID=164759 RepID=UPI0028A76C14|nr:tetratricopeptide repeat protein [Diaphorobacter nitroreducens]
MTESSKTPYVYAAALLIAVLCIYLPSLGNGLVFDDLRLSDGTIFGEYGSLLQIKQRMLSYGSFVWIQDLFGDGWWKQRTVNLALHLGVVAALFALLKSLIGMARFPQEFEEQEHFVRSRAAALRVGVALFALNPVAVYAVAYLAQRSILMATLFAVLACWMFVRGLQTSRASWFAGALLSYVAAVLSKEYAVMTVAMAVPLYIFVRRPGWKQIATIVGVALLVLMMAIGALWSVYGHVIGRLFDPQSLALAQQLEALRPGITQQIYPLSILNEAALFFVYGLLWVFPNVQWMSIDLRPAFPLSFGSSWHLLGALSYLALLLTSLWLAVRRSNLWGLAGLLLLFPLLWYVTEFSTVWVQDPFVLYRSYLWAVALPGLAAIVLTGFKPRSIYIVGVVLGVLFSALALERVMSLKDAGSAWGDAADKISPTAPPNAVGRSRAYLNLGAYQLEKGLLTQAERSFATADALGDPQGNARFNTGVALQQQKKHAEALQAFDKAQAKGFSGQSLHYHRGESAFALGQYAKAYQNFDAALKAPAEAIEGGEKMQQLLRLRHAEAAIGANQFDAAIADFNLLLQQSPGNSRLELGLGMALVGKGDTARAIGLFDRLLARAPNPAAFYGRGLAHQRGGNQAQALKDLDQAIRMDPRNPQYRAVREQIATTKSQKP